MLLGYDIRSDMLWPTHVMESGEVYPGTDRTASHWDRENLLMFTGSWFAVEGAGKHLSVAQDSVCRSIEHKALPALNVGRLWQLTTSEVDPWVRVGGAESEGPENHRGEAQG